MIKIALIFLLFGSINGYAQSSISPTIIVQPSNVTATVGSTATFAVSAAGTAPLTYQWYSSVNNGSFTAMAGQINSFRTTGALVLANNGNRYYCVITNAYGSVTSTIITLTVNPSPTPSPSDTDIFYQTSVNTNWQETDCNTICVNQSSRCSNDCENLRDNVDDFYNDTNGQYQGNQITQLGFN